MGWQGHPAGGGGNVVPDRAIPGCHSWRVGALERRSAISLRFIPLPGRSRPDFARCQRQAAPPHPGCPWSGSTSRAAPLQTLAASPSICGGANGGAGADLGAPGCAGPRRVRGSQPVPWPLRAPCRRPPGSLCLLLTPPATPGSAGRPSRSPPPPPLACRPSRSPVRAAGLAAPMLCAATGSCVCFQSSVGCCTSLQWCFGCLRGCLAAPPRTCATSFHFSRRVDAGAPVWLVPRRHARRLPHRHLSVRAGAGAEPHRAGAGAPAAALARRGVRGQQAAGGRRPHACRRLHRAGALRAGRWGCAGMRAALPRPLRRWQRAACLVGVWAWLAGGTLLRPGTVPQAKPSLFALPDPAAPTPSHPSAGGSRQAAVPRPAGARRPPPGLRVGRLARHRPAAQRLAQAGGCGAAAAGPGGQPGRRH